ncbi:AAA family ATPase [bacterium]|nr:MAG: AAA family ATPase [bacterium]
MSDSIKSILNNHTKKLIKDSNKYERKEFANIPEALKHNLNMFTSYGELMSRKFPESEWVAEPLIPEGLTVMSAQPASYKTWLLLDIAIAISTGGQLFDTFETVQGGVLMVDEENSERLLQQRLKLLGEESDLPIYFMIEKNFKLDDTQISKLIKFCKEKSIRLVTFDSLVRIHNNNENDAVQMSEVFAKLKRFTKARINVLITHHNRKGGKGDNPSQEMRGSSDILAAVDCHISLKRSHEDKQISITQTKVRFTEELEPFDMKIITHDDMVKFEYLGTSSFAESKREITKSKIRELLVDGKILNQKDILQNLEELHSKTNAKTLRKILSIMISDDEVKTAPGRGSEILYSIK